MSRTTLGSRRSGPAEDRAQPAEDRSRRTRRGSGLTTSIRRAGGALTNRMTAEAATHKVGLMIERTVVTLGVRADMIHMYDLHMCMCRCDRAEVVLTLFISKMGSKMPLNRKIRTAGIKGLATEVVASRFEPNLMCCCFTSVSGLDRLFSRQLRPQSDIKLATV